jgi:hypothetical protein
MQVFACFLGQMKKLPPQSKSTVLQLAVIPYGLDPLALRHRLSADLPYLFIF